eukprot:1159744-Pelagomonas_calceolata.AAC.11
MGKTLILLKNTGLLILGPHPHGTFQKLRKRCNPNDLAQGCAKNRERCKFLTKCKTNLSKQKYLDAMRKVSKCNKGQQQFCPYAAV